MAQRNSKFTVPGSNTGMDKLILDHITILTKLTKHLEMAPLGLKLRILRLFSG